jgi:hypothetical protein
VGGARTRAEDPRGVLIQFDAFCARLPAGTRSIARTAYYRMRAAGQIDFRQIRSLEELLFKLQLAVRRDLAESESRWREMMDDFEKAYRAWKAEFRQEMNIRAKNGEARVAEENRTAETRRIAYLAERTKRGIVDPQIVTGWGRERYGGYLAAE